jgi:hypothetical protein
MNGYTKEIASILSCSLDRAKKIQDHMEEEIGIDYSECSSDEFLICVLQAAMELRVR